MVAKSKMVATRSIGVTNLTKDKCVKVKTANSHERRPIVPQAKACLPVPWSLVCCMSDKSASGPAKNHDPEPQVWLAQKTFMVGYSAAWYATTKWNWSRSSW